MIGRVIEKNRKVRRVMSGPRSAGLIVFPGGRGHRTLFSKRQVLYYGRTPRRLLGNVAYTNKSKAYVALVGYSGSRVGARVTESRESDSRRQWCL